MIEILIKDYSEFIIGIPSLIIATLTTIWVSKKQSSKKELTYTINSYYDLISEKIRKSKLQIIFNGNEYNKVSTLSLDIKNNGNIPIEPADFIKNLNIIFSKKTKVLEFTITEKYPKNLEIKTGIKKNIITLSPFLLNKNEFFRLQFLLGNNSSFDFDTRIKGITELKKIELQKTNSGMWKRYSYYYIKFNLVLFASYIGVIYIYESFISESFTYNFFIFWSFYLIIPNILFFTIDSFLSKYRWYKDTTTVANKKYSAFGR